MTNSQQRVQHRDRRAFHGGEDARTDAEEDQRHQQQAGQGRHEAPRQDRDSGEGFGAVAGTTRQHVGGDHHRQGHQQCRQHARREQVDDRHATAGCGGEQDQVVRGRHQQGDQRGVDAHVHRVVLRVAALDHLRDHRAADGGHVGDRRAGDPAEEQRGHDADLPQPAAHAPDERAGEPDQALRDAAAHHDLASEDEQRNRDQR